MKKILRILGITIGIILLLIIFTPVLFKSKIESVVKAEINNQVEASVDWNKFSLTFFRGFPDLSVNLHGLAVVGNAPFEGDTLVALNRFELRVSPLSAIKGNVQVKAIILNRPLINGIVLEDGTSNWDIVPEEESEDENGEGETGSDGDEAGSGLGLSLERFAIEHGRVSYNDIPGSLAAAIGDLNLEVRGDFAMEQTDVELMLGVYGIDAKSGGIRYMRNGDLELDVNASADMINNLYTLNKNEIRLNGLVLGTEGTVEMPEDGSIVTDLRFFTKETTFRTLLSMVPAVYLSDFESLETSGSMALEGTVKGVMKDTLLPDVVLQLAVKDGFFSYPEVPKDVSDVQIDLAVDYRGSDMDATTVQLERFHLLLGDNPFDINLQVANPFSDMQVSGLVKGMIDFATLKDVVPMEDLDLTGRLETDLTWDTRLSYIENEDFENVNLNGKVVIEGVYVEAPDIPVPVELTNLAMFFTPRYVNLETVDLLLGSSDLHLDGRLTNFIPYVFEGQTIAGELNVSSKLLNVDELMPPSEDSKEAEGDPVEENPSETTAGTDSAASPSPVKIPENIDFAMVLSLDKIMYDRIVIENMTGDLGVREGVAQLEGLDLDILKGSVSVKGTVDTRADYAKADVAMNMLGIDIPAAYNTFVAIEKLAPVAKYCEGAANVEMDLFTMLDGDFNPLYESIQADGHLYARDLKVEQPPALEKVSTVIKNEKLRNLELEKADIKFAVRDGRVIVEPFDMNFGDSKIVASGSHGIDQTMDYIMDMTIAKSDLGGAANQLMASVSALASGAGLAIPQSDYIKVRANITGTFNDPEVATDLSGNLGNEGKTVKEVAREKVEEKVGEKVEEVKEEVKEEASEKAAELIRTAEEEKEKLMAEAEKQGDRLVDEAEKKGDQLIEDAGRNPIKKLAAEKAAEELVKQAEKKRSALIEEAEEMGDALIDKAKAEAERL